MFERGCGKARKGQLYMLIPTGKDGIPLWNFLLDPTVPVDDRLGVPKLGNAFIHRETPSGKTVYDVWDHIGSGSYPNAWDWIWECAILGFHQLISWNAPLDKITRESNYIAVHSEAGIKAPENYYKDLVEFVDFGPRCEKHPGAEYEGSETCPQVLRNDIAAYEKGVKVFDVEPWSDAAQAYIPMTNPTQSDMSDVQKARLVKRQMPAFWYVGLMAPKDEKPEYVRSAFMSFPIGMMARFVFYQDKDNDEHKERIDLINSRLKVSKLEVLDSDDFDIDES